jgi:16S rRNA (cytidine1402-2'-O)-methyltransferase
MKPVQLLGKLYLIPCTLSNPGETTVVPEDVLPQSIKRTIDFIDYYIVENEKTARRFIKSINPEKKQPSLHISLLNKHTEVEDHYEMIKPLLNLVVLVWLIPVQLL